MKFPLQFTLTGDYRADLKHIQMSLAQIDEGLEPTLEKNLLEAARFIKTMAKSYVHVDTGSLQKSIRIEHIRKLAVRVRAGGYIVNPKTGKLVNYAVYVEERFPFLRPAWEQGKKFVISRVQESMREIVNV